MIKIHSGKNVLQAAKDRINWLFDEFQAKGKPLAVSTSGGKDSTVVYELSRAIAAERGYPLPVMWLDQECEYESTVEYVRWQMHQPGIVPMWMQIPFRLFNTTDHNEQWLHVWDAEHPERWIRPKEPDSFQENIYGTDRFAKVLGKIGDRHFTDGATMCGLRAEEAPGRRLGLTGEATYKWITWVAWLPHHMVFSPIYDWTWRDVWKAIHEHGWPYNSHYDAMYQHGVPVPRMRVSNYHHETAVWSLFHLQEIEPETYAKATQRLAGIHTAAHLGAKDFRPQELPFMFDSWLEYRDFLNERLPTPENKARFERKFASLRKSFPRAYAEIGERLAKAEAHAVISNDWEFVLLDSTFTNLPPHLGREKKVKVVA